MATLPQLMRAAEERRKTAERAVSDKKNDVRRYVDSLKEAGIAEHEMTQDQVERNHQHIERRLLGGPPEPGQRGHAGKVHAVGAQQGETDEDDPEKRSHPRPDGRCVNAPAAVAH